MNARAHELIHPPHCATAEPTREEGGRSGLPIAAQWPTAACLEARLPGYAEVHDPAFTARMAVAIARAERRVARHLRENTLSPAAVRTVLLEIGVERRAIEVAKVARGEVAAFARGEKWAAARTAHAYLRASDYGRPLPATVRSHDDRMVDCVTEKNRHRAYVDRCRDVVRARTHARGEGGLRLSLAGSSRRVPLTLIWPDPAEHGAYLALHPDFVESRILAQRGYQLVAAALREPDLNERQLLRCLAVAVFLFMHGTPFKLGTPSCVESLVDACLRARLGKTLPRKRIGVEPFWEAMLAPPGKKGLATFVDAYRSFYEPTLERSTSARDDGPGRSRELTQPRLIG